MYEAPRITEVGSVRELTLATGGSGSEDKVLWTSPYGYQFEFGYGGAS